MSRPDSSQTIRVWDPLVRVFHWSLALFFFIAFLSGDHFLTLHVWAGYTVALLLCFRLFWGVVGTPYARFSSFVRTPSAVIDYLRAMLRLRVPHYLGHNPAAAAMVIALLAILALVTTTGMIIIAAEGQGPLAGSLLASLDANAMEEVHEILADLALTLVFLHLAGVLVSSLLEGQNLPRAMITGKKKYRDDYMDHAGEKS